MVGERSWCRLRGTWSVLGGCLQEKDFLERVVSRKFAGVLVIGGGRCGSSGRWMVARRRCVVDLGIGAYRCGGCGWKMAVRRKILVALGMYGDLGK